MAALQGEQEEGNVVGLNLKTGEPMDPIQEGVYDSFRVLRNCIASSSGIASNLLLCDEMLKARQMVSRLISTFLMTSDRVLILHRVGSKDQGLVKAKDDCGTNYAWRLIKVWENTVDIVTKTSDCVHGGSLHALIH